jgi:hypothetical protein
MKAHLPCSILATGFLTDSKRSKITDIEIPQSLWIKIRCFLDFRFFHKDDRDGVDTCSLL